MLSSPAEDHLTPQHSNPIPPSLDNSSVEDLDFFDSTSLLPLNQELDLNTLDQTVVVEPLNTCPINEIIGDVCERNIVKERLRLRHEANLVS
jgi:hypothetical protein